MLKFIVDTQLPPVLASFLIRKGYDALHTTNYPNGHLLNDNEIVNNDLIDLIQRHLEIIIKELDQGSKLLMLTNSQLVAY